MALGTLRTAERASVIHLSPMFLVAEITISSFHPSGRVDGSRISQNLLSKQAVRIQNIFAKISWEFRWTRVSNIAKDSDALVYTTRLPLEFHLPPNRRAPSPSKQVEALSRLMMRKPVIIKHILHTLSGREGPPPLSHPRQSRTTQKESFLQELSLAL